MNQFSLKIPHDIDAERAVLASMMLAGGDAGLFDRTRSMLTANSFFLVDHGTCFTAICDLAKRGVPIDAITVRDELAGRKILADVGGAAYVAQILGSVPSAAHGPHYARIVREHQILRGVISAANRAIGLAYAPGSSRSAADVARGFLRELTALACDGEVSRIVPLGDVIAEVAAAWDDPLPRRIPTGLRDLDAMIGGIPIGKFTLVGGRPRIGKSQLCKQIALNAARSGIACGIVAIEENSLKIAQNYLSNATGIENRAIVYGTIQPSDVRRLVAAIPGLAQLPIFIADSPVKLGDVESVITTMVVDHGCGMVIVDYLQLIDGGSEVNENREITLISRTLKAAFKRLGIAGIAACQLNRGNETGGVRRPAMRDLRGSGSLEQDGDLIILLHRADAYAEPGEPHTHQMEAIITKNKDGPGGMVPLRFSGRTQSITDWDVDPFAPRYRGIIDGGGVPA